jgi:hypothetical protein|tara:strand:+ start:275 stop:448 length:174 start_codon:yes stop_codon:yes gene_type:complete
MPLKKVTEEIAQVGLINGGTLLATTFIEIEMVLKIILLSLTIGYTLYKWYTHYKRNK